MKLNALLAALTLSVTGSLWADLAILESRKLKVTVDTGFPRIVQYESKVNGQCIGGQSSPVTSIELNGTITPCKVTFTETSNQSGKYVLDFEQAQIAVTLQITVNNDHVDYRVTNVVESGPTKLMSFAFPDNALLYYKNTPSEVEIATVISTISEGYKKHATAGIVYKHLSRETINKLSDIKPAADTGNYFFISDGKLAAGIASNHCVDVKRTAYKVEQVNGDQTCAAWCPEWIYRQIDSETLEFPFAKIFITADCNGDGKATWQDAAIVYRHTMPKPYGHEYTKKLVGENIAMNFASGAQQPFLRILDEIKKIHRATDGIDNQVIIKGFSAEGHDSANTDYSENYNERAGGLGDLNILLEEAKRYNSRIGVHINASEIYPESRRFNPETLMYKDGKPQKGWVWLDQSYYLDKRRDLLEGDLIPSLKKMRQELPELDFIYLDKDHVSRWESMKLAKAINDLDLPLYVEGTMSLDPWVTWSHWRGGPLSRIMLFLWYSERDLYTNQPILRGGRSDHDGFMGWQNKHDFNSFIHGTFSRRLPAKYLQHFELLRWEPGKSAVFSGDVNGKKEGDTVTYSRNGRAFMTWSGSGSQSRIFVPWDPIKENKIYVWDEVGTPITWKLPECWKSSKTVYLYKLTDRGRCGETEVSVVDGEVTITPLKNTPYVIYRNKAPEQQTYKWGEGSLVKDPGFDSYGFKDWKSFSNGICIENDSRRNARLVIKETDAVSISQEIEGLQPGKTYAASVWVLVNGKRKASLEILPMGVENAEPVSNYVDICNVKHGMPNDPRKGSNYQRLKVMFDTPKDCSKALLSLKAEKGGNETVVEFDDVRMLQVGRSTKAANHWFYEDFENVDMGYGPFTCSFGERTHLSESNKPYTNDTINGRFSFKTRDGGRVVRTLPSTIRFNRWNIYKLVCETLTSPGGRGRIVVESQGKVVLNQIIPTGRHRIEAEFTTAGDDDSFMSIYKDAGDMLVIDDIAIDDLGKVPEDKN